MCACVRVRVCVRVCMRAGVRSCGCVSAWVRGLAVGIHEHIRTHTQSIAHSARPLSDDRSWTNTTHVPPHSLPRTHTPTHPTRTLTYTDSHTHTHTHTHTHSHTHSRSHSRSPPLADNRSWMFTRVRREKHTPQCFEF